ncbi:MAG: GNAT family N-acetyltransferase [Candidatus Hermodarchaeota archaeon]
MYTVSKSNYSKSKYEKILSNLRESLINYFTENVQHKDLKEAESWYERIENIIKSKNEDYTCFDVKKKEDIVGFLIFRHISQNFALIRHFFILDIVNREEVAYILLKEALEKLKSTNENIKFDNAAFTFPEDYLANSLKRLGYSIVKRNNMTLILDMFNKTYELLPEYSFTHFNENDFLEIAELCVDAFKNHPDTTFWEDINSVPLYFEYLKNSMTTYMLKDCSFVVKDKIEKIVGICLIENGDHEGEFIIQNIAVNKALRGKGIGKALLSKCLNSIRKKGYRKAILTVTEGIPAQKMYEKLGFKNYTSFFVITNA